MFIVKQFDFISKNETKWNETKKKNKKQKRKKKNLWEKLENDINKKTKKKELE